jgi:PKHD-type hydroxylase
VGWIESYLKNEIDRVTLFQLDSGAKGLLAKHGHSEELDLIFLAYTNLLRSLGT